MFSDGSGKIPVKDLEKTGGLEMDLIKEKAVVQCRFRTDCKIMRIRDNCDEII